MPHVMVDSRLHEMCTRHSLACESAVSPNYTSCARGIAYLVNQPSLLRSTVWYEPSSKSPIVNLSHLSYQIPLP
jgi:hypothetical protein